MSDQVEVDGADRLARTLRAAGQSFRDWTGTNRKVATQVAVAASQRAPRRTGRLASSYSTGDTSTDTAAVTFGVAYARPIHWGVGPRRGLRGPHNISATRFATEALADTQPTWLGTYTDRVNDVIRTIKGA